MEVSGQLHRPGRFTTGESADLNVVARRKKIPASAGNRTPLIQVTVLMKLSRRNLGKLLGQESKPVPPRYEATEP
jgi:hypothetical protein